MAKHEVRMTRTTKRGGQNSLPDDPFKVEPEVSMDAMKMDASSDGRNPAITSGKALPSSFGAPQK